jgi:hypothetical protein
MRRRRDKRVVEAELLVLETEKEDNMDMHHPKEGKTVRCPYDKFCGKKEECGHKGEHAWSHNCEIPCSYYNCPGLASCKAIEGEEHG